MPFLPPRRKPLRSGIERAPQRSFPKHERWVRGHCCIVPGCQNRDIQFMHLRSAANSGTGLKPSSAYGIPGCGAHHGEAHLIGHDTFAMKYGLDLWALAEAFARRSPDKALREAMRAA